MKAPLHKSVPGAGIIRNAGIIRGRALYEEIRYVAPMTSQSEVGPIALVRISTKPNACQQIRQKWIIGISFFNFLYVKNWRWPLFLIQY